MGQIVKLAKRTQAITSMSVASSCSHCSHVLQHPSGSHRSSSPLANPQMLEALKVAMTPVTKVTGISGAPNNNDGGRGTHSGGGRGNGWGAPSISPPMRHSQPH